MKKGGMYMRATIFDRMPSNLNGFWRGFFRALDFCRIFFSDEKIHSDPSNLSDKQKLQGDWTKVGSSMRSAIDKYKRSHNL